MRFDESDELFAVDKDRIQAFPLLYCQQIQNQYLKGEKDAALKAIEEFVNNRPKIHYGYTFWADLLIYEEDEKGQYPNAEKAIELAEDACEMQPKNMSARATLGMAEYRADKIESAIESLERAEKAGFKHPLVWLYLAMAHHDAGNQTEAIESLAKSEQWIRNMTGTIPQLNKLLKEAQTHIRD